MTYLKHNKTDIAFLQETHFIEGEALKLKRSWVGHIFHSSISSKQNGVIILTNKNVSFTLLEIKDKERRMVCTQALINGSKLILCNIYAPNKGNPGQIILAGDFNQS